MANEETKNEKDLEMEEKNDSDDKKNNTSLRATKEEQKEQEKKKLSDKERKELKFFMWKGVKFILIFGLIAIAISVGFYYLLAAI